MTSDESIIVTSRESGWWTSEREAQWRRLDEATDVVEKAYVSEVDCRPYSHGGWIHASAPNPESIIAETTPDDWYVSIGGAPGGINSLNVELVADLLSDELGETVRIHPRPDDWADGYWLTLPEAGDDGE